MKVGVTVNLSPVQPKINGRSQLRTHLLLNAFDYKTVSQIFVKCICSVFISRLS